MVRIRMLVELKYDQDLMYANDKEAKEWFFELLKNGKLFLYDYEEIGDEIGEIKVLQIIPRGKKVRVGDFFMGEKIQMKNNKKTPKLSLKEKRKQKETKRRQKQEQEKQNQYERK